MSTVIHQILVKKTQRNLWGFVNHRLIIGPIDKCPDILASLFISFQIKSCTMPCWLANDLNPQLEEIVSNFEITNKRIFSVAGQMFTPYRSRLPT